MEKISWADHVTNEKELHGVEDERNILHIIKQKES
jgi:hypothetical protein